MPVVNSACINAADITATLTRLLQSSLVLANSVAITPGTDRSQLLAESLIGIYLPEYIEITFVASLKGLICFFVAEHFCCTLQQIRIALEGTFSDGGLPLLNTSFWRREVSSSDRLGRGP